MILIRKALPEESEVIASFQREMAMETEQMILDPVRVDMGVKAVFSDPSKGCYYVAEIDGGVKGSLLVTYEWSDWRNSKVVWIQSVYILPGFRKIGIFRRLYDFIKQMVETGNEYSGIRLYVDRRNIDAIEVYRRCGMDGDHYKMFEWIRDP
jgi:GNAT superfamily N-acetyltransferase